MFIDLNNKNVLIVGGGNVAYRKAMTFLDFHANVMVVSTEVMDAMYELDVEVIQDEYKDIYLQGKDLVVASTDDTKLNHRIAQDCRNRNILVNAVDQVEDCDFIFPSIVKEKDIVAAFSSSGYSPVLTQYLKEKNKEIITETLGCINEYMGSIRLKIQNRVPFSKRKELYRTILNLCIDKNRPLSEKELEEVIKNG